MITREIDIASAVRRMHDQVDSILKNIDIEHAYDHFPDYADYAPMLPYIVWSYTEHDFYADNSIYYRYYTIALTLYEAERDISTEGAVEAALSDYYATKAADYDENAAVYAVTYEFDLGGSNL
ncbi:hypothetical protein [Galactobacillus timonensis]|uniref:hypothetical protein n=1 Tax=Galactobacillus timonensis TaxID=2041840 RepID=UPI000C859697|nr:hypothetical protein [Galactobacillus timonensis]